MKKSDTRKSNEFVINALSSGCPEEAVAIQQEHAQSLTRSQTKQLADRLENNAACQTCVSAWLSIWALLEETRQPSISSIADDYRVLKRLVVQQRTELQLMHERNSELSGELSTSLLRYEEEEEVLNSLESEFDELKASLQAFSPEACETASIAIETNNSGYQEKAVIFASECAEQQIPSSDRRNLLQIQFQDIKIRLESLTDVVIQQLSAETWCNEAGRCIQLLAHKCSKPQCFEVATQSIMEELHLETQNTAVQTSDQSNFGSSLLEIRIEAHEVGEELKQLREILPEDDGFGDLERSVANMRAITKTSNQNPEIVLAITNLEKELSRESTETGNRQPLKLEFASYGSLFAMLEEELRDESV